jgi:folate-binding protein YgfZ
MVQFFSPKGTPIQWQWIGFKGSDAQDFLHRLTTVNTRNLLPGEGAAGCFLTPQGKIRAYFWLWCLGAGDYAFEFDAGKSGHWKTELLATIEQFTFAETLEITPQTPEACVWLLGQTGLQIQGVQKLPNGLTACQHGSEDFGIEWISLSGPQSAIDALLTSEKAIALSYEKIEALRIQAGHPWVDHEITGAYNPLEAGLRSAVAPNKGCYPGQEVIEKIAALGSPARRLAKIDGTGPLPEIGKPVLGADSAEAGVVTSVTSTAAGFTALAYVKKTHAKEGLELHFGQASSRGKIVHLAPYTQ